MAKTLTLRLTRQIDIIQIHIGDFPSIYRKMLVALPLMIMPRSKTILHVHGAAFLNEYAQQPKWAQALVRRFIQRFDLVIALSEKWRSDLQTLFQIKSILVLPNAVNVPEQPPERDLSTERKFLFLGHIGSRKGVFDLLNATQKMESDNTPFSLKIGGNGEILKLNAAIDQAALGNKVSYCGWVTGRVRDEVMNQSHVLVLPSYAEGAPMSILEGMAMGMPVISTRVGAIPEMVQHGKNGFLIEPGDIDGLIKAMTILSQDEKLCRAMAINSHTIAKEYFSLTAHEAMLHNAYNNLLCHSVDKFQ
ncbi:glycosyltransferase involved in cell wall biosynthesis [Novosphingobium sp. 1529]